MANFSALGHEVERILKRSVWVAMNNPCLLTKQERQMMLLGALTHINETNCSGTLILAT
ncbi:hypothetical protein ACWWJF_09690 [Symbiopectobacterium sp. Eva_TO]